MVDFNNHVLGSISMTFRFFWLTGEVSHCIKNIVDKYYYTFITSSLTGCYFRSLNFKIVQILDMFITIRLTVFILTTPVLNWQGISEFI